MAPTLCVVYRHQSGCANGDCPNDITTVQDRGDAERAIQTKTGKPPKGPVELVGVYEM